MTKGRLQSALASTPAVTCMKTLLMVFNFIFWITGIAILAVGIWTKVQLYMYMELSTVYYREAPYIMIGVGAVIVLVGSLGCCCTLKGHAILLYLYAVFLLMVFIAELSAGISGFVYKGKLETGFQDGLSQAFEAYPVTKKDAIDGLQRNLHCCGIDSYRDWFSTPWGTKEGGRSVPKSCCKVNENVCKNTDLPLTGGNSTNLDINTVGCYKYLLDFMDSNMAIIGGVALGISFFQLFGALIAFCLARNINKAKYEMVA